MSIIHPVIDLHLVFAFVVQNILQFDVLVFVCVVVWYDWRIKIPDVVHGPQSLFVIEILELQPEYLRR
jgi:hypothetical protein